MVFFSFLSCPLVSVVAAVVVAAAVVVPQFNLESRKKFVITLLDDLHIVYPSLVI